MQLRQLTTRVLLASLILIQHLNPGSAACNRKIVCLASPCPIRPKSNSPPPPSYDPCKGLRASLSLVGCPQGNSGCVVSQLYNNSTSMCTKSDWGMPKGWQDVPTLVDPRSLIVLCSLAPSTEEYTTYTNFVQRLVEPRTPVLFISSFAQQYSWNSTYGSKDFSFGPNSEKVCEATFLWTAPKENLTCTGTFLPQGLPFISAYLSCNPSVPDKPGNWIKLLQLVGQQTGSTGFSPPPPDIRTNEEEEEETASNK